MQNVPKQIPEENMADVDVAGQSGGRNSARRYYLRQTSDFLLVIIIRIHSPTRSADHISVCRIIGEPDLHINTICCSTGFGYPPFWKYLPVINENLDIINIIFDTIS